MLLKDKPYSRTEQSPNWVALAKTGKHLAKMVNPDSSFDRNFQVAATFRRFPLPKIGSITPSSPGWAWGATGEAAGGQNTT